MRKLLVICLVLLTATPALMPGKFSTKKVEKVASDVLDAALGEVSASPAPAAEPDPGGPPQPAAPADLEALFAAAERDPAQVVPLLVTASARLTSMDGDAGHRLADRLEPVARRAFFSPERLPGMERLGLGVHTVRSGELPGRIARQYGMSAELFGYLNEGYDPRRVGIGAGLKYLDLSDGALRLVVDATRFRLGAWRRLEAGGWVLVAYVPVGLGAPESPTPTGSTKVVQRVLDPEWTHPETGQVFAPNDQGNLLGGYWMRLEAEGLGKSGIGFHGYTGEATGAWLEKRASNGCVRMRQPDIDRIFHLAVEGTPVTIVE